MTLLALWKDRYLAYCCMKDYCDDVVTKDGLVPKDRDVLNPKKKCVSDKVQKR